MVERAAGFVDRMDGRGLWCELWMDADGEVTLTRGHGCTPDDAVDLCRLVSTGDPVVRDWTEGGAPEPDHPSFSWLRSGQ